MIPNRALRALVLRRCGFDPGQLNADQFQERLADIVEAVNAEYRATTTVQKSAVNRFGSFVPNLGYEREETVKANSNRLDSADPNSVFDSVFPS